ncbi:MAG: hypothetical protein NVS3B26_16770 [Mycobacteriales bacterium]
MTVPPGLTRVLIVDDTSDYRMLLRVALELDGLSVVDDVGDGAAAVAAARQHQPDVVLLDLAMPVMDGLEALPLIAQASPSSKVIVLSGFQAQSMEASALAAGAHAYQQKGATPDQIIASVWAVLGRSPDSTSAEQAVAADALTALPERDVVWGWLEAAPVATVVLDRDKTRVLHHNSAAAQLLGWQKAPPVGAAAQVTSQVLAGHQLRYTFPDDAHAVAFLPLQPDSTVEVGQIRAAIAATAHEIRNPVATLLGMTQLLSTEAGRISPDVQKQMLSSLGRQARVLDRVTADLLTAAQAGRGTLRIHASDVLLLPALHATAATVDEHVDIDCPAGLAVHADPVRLDQILLNLMSNALKYARPPFRWSVETADMYAFLHLDDNGDGVPAEFRARLFDEFSRAPGTTVAGSGIGLHIVRVLAERQGGTVRYQPRPSGGSRFTVSLPLAVYGDGPGASTLVR